MTTYTPPHQRRTHHQQVVAKKIATPVVETIAPVTEEVVVEPVQPMKGLKAFAAVRAYQAHQLNHGSREKRREYDDWIEEYRDDLQYMYRRFVDRRMPYRIFAGLAYRCTETKDYASYVTRGSLDNNFLTVNAANHLLERIREYCWYKGIVLFNRNNADMILLSTSFH